MKSKIRAQIFFTFQHRSWEPPGPAGRKQISAGEVDASAGGGCREYWRWVLLVITAKSQAICPPNMPAWSEKGPQQVLA